ncbi:12540_t:CDS:2 [Ambispora leptoticha]|uniref:12540_t:CDS:1 n=1 Tax=Ambispora leptoticha TaxID=144679 RepID=A0A9N9ADH9_9GLOM|nr:12540_t:CDS:2 [Ambispora leptoticha]
METLFHELTESIQENEKNRNQLESLLKTDSQTYAKHLHHYLKSNHQKHLQRLQNHTVKVKDTIANMVEEVIERDIFLSMDDWSDMYKQRNQSLRDTQRSEFEMMQVLLSQELDYFSSSYSATSTVVPSASDLNQASNPPPPQPESSCSQEMSQFSSSPQFNPNLTELLNQASTLPADQLCIIQTLINTMVMNNSQQQQQ